MNPNELFVDFALRRTRTFARTARQTQSVVYGAAARRGPRSCAGRPARRPSPGGPSGRARPGSRAATARTRRPGGRGGADLTAAARGPRRRARGRRGATSPRGSRGVGAGATGSAGSRRLGAAHRRLLEAGERGPAAEHEALAERVGGEPVGAVQPGAGALADRVQAGDAVRAAVEVGRDPAHHVVAGGGDRDELRRRVQPGLAQRGDDVGEAARVDVAHVEDAAARSRQRVDRAGDRVARRELVDEALARPRRAASRPRRGPPRRSGSPRGP